MMEVMAEKFPGAFSGYTLKVCGWEPHAPPRQPQLHRRQEHTRPPAEAFKTADTITQQTQTPQNCLCPETLTPLLLLLLGLTVLLMLPPHPTLWSGA